MRINVKREESDEWKQEGRSRQKEREGTEEAKGDKGIGRRKMREGKHMEHRRKMKQQR